MDYETPDYDIDPITGQLVREQKTTLVQNGLNKNLVAQIAREQIAATGSTGGGTTSPLTTKGDLYGYSTANARIPIGVDGQVLIADSAEALGLRWGTNSAVVTYNVATKTADYTLANSNDYVIFTASGKVLTFHDATTATQKPFTIKNASSGNMTFATTSSQTVDGSTSGTIVPNQSITVISDGSNWYIV